MISPEKNDVDISKLFNWNKKTVIFGVDGIETIELYMRLVGDADWNIARVKAMRASAELRRKLNNPESDEYLAYIPIQENIEKDSLIQMMLILDMPDIREEVIKSIDLSHPNEPGDNASLEELEQYQAEIDGYEEKRHALITKEFEKVLEKKRKELNKSSLENLSKDYNKNLVNTLCKEELNRIFLSYTTYFGTYKDKNFTERLYESFEEFNNLPTVIKTQLMNEYVDLDVKMYDLKK